MLRLIVVKPSACEATNKSRELHGYTELRETQLFNLLSRVKASSEPVGPKRKPANARAILALLFVAGVPQRATGYDLSRRTAASSLRRRRR